MEATLLDVAHRQWTLSLPRALRLSVLKVPALFKQVEKALVRAVWWWQRAQARRLGASGHLEGGAVAMVQYFGSHLQLTVEAVLRRMRTTAGKDVAHGRAAVGGG